MRNTIANRVADFLKRYHPFDLLNEDQLLEISTGVRIQYVEKSGVIFAIEQALGEEFYVIYKGAVSLNKEIDGSSKAIDKVDEGDVFGLRPMFAKENYAMTAIADEECILYAIPISTFRPIAEKNKKVGSYLIECFASNTENPYSKEFENRLFIGNDDGSSNMDELFELQQVQYVKNVITAKPDCQIKDIARLMNEHGINSVIIEENELPTGIITDKDLRRMVATGDVPIEGLASMVMSSPVLCYPKDLSIAQAQITMMKHGVTHLCITKDGTPNSKIIGILTQHDITLMKGNNPAVLMKAIQRSNSTKELKKIRENVMNLLEGYIMQSIPLKLTNKIIFELNDATIKRVIERCIEKMDSPPPVKFAWMSLGSQGRKEQLLQTDQDNAIVFENVTPELLEETRSYFLLLAKKVNKRLNKIGFDFCPAEMMANNSKWCLSLDEWKSQFDSWTSETGIDEILLSSIFFDFDISFGDSALTNQLAEHVLSITKNNHIFLSKMAASVLRSPSPFGFFKQFIVEEDEKRKDLFDIKQRGLVPFTDAGRILSLEYQLKNINNTAERFEALAERVPEKKELFLSCSFAFKALSKFKTKHGLLNHDSGSLIQLTDLSKEEKMKLKRCFKTLWSIQEYLKNKYQIKYL